MDLERFARIVRQRRDELGLTQEEVADSGGPTDTTIGKIENAEWTPGNRHATLRKLDTGLRWEAGSAKRTLNGGDPTPLDTDPMAHMPANVRETIEKIAAVELPRDAYYASTLGVLDQALGVHPTAPPLPLKMSAGQRRLLASARNKLSSLDGNLTAEESSVLTWFVEESELRSLHIRIDHLPRAEQLEVSSFVNELEYRIEDRVHGDGYTNEDEQWPDYAQPNPLLLEENADVLEIETEQNAPAEADEVEEDELDGAKTPPFRFRSEDRGAREYGADE